MANNYIKQIANFFGVEALDIRVLDHSECDGSANVLIEIEGMDYEAIFDGSGMEVFLPNSGVKVVKA